MSREEIAAFLASLKKLRDGLDAFNGSLADIDGAGMRLGLLPLQTDTLAQMVGVERQEGAGLAASQDAARSTGEITLEMLEAGASVVDELCGRFEPRFVAQQVYTAMARTSPLGKLDASPLKPVLFSLGTLELEAKGT